MGLGLYKAGQGYWVRVLSATFAGVLVLIASAWLWTQLAQVNLPTASWSMSVNPATGSTGVGEASAGQPVIFLGEVTEVGKPGPEVAKGEFVSIRAGSSGQILTVKNLQFKPGSGSSLIKSVAPAAESKATLIGRVSGVRGVPLFDPLYLQAGGVSVLIIVGGIIIYLFVGARQNSVEFLIATDGEMKKVNWSSKKDIIGSTQVVILWSVLLVAGLFLVDLAFSSFFRLIGVLQSK